MESHHSVPSRTEAFPVGLRVLVVDDDPTWLKILEKMLRKCSYEVTTCGLARVALDILRERKNKFDIVISDVNMPDMDGFKLLELIGLEMDLPVIMMSIDGETSRVMKGVQHGACDYLLKPVRMKELRNIWQHVYRKKMHEVKEIEGHEFTCDDLQLIRDAGFEGFEERGFLTREDRKRKEEHSDQDGSDQNTVKKARVVWSVDLHQKFVNAVNQIGFDKVGPKKILDLMNVPGLTRENVASHLQKYRLYLSRLQKQNEDPALGNNGRTDLVPKEPPTKSDQKTSSQLQQSTISNPNTGFGLVAPKTETQPIKPTSHPEEDVKVKRKASSVPSLGMLLSFTSTVPNAAVKTSEPLTTSKHPGGGLPFMQFMQYPKHDHERCDLLGDYSCLPKPDLYTSAPPVISINMHNGTGDLFDMKPALMDCIKAISPLTCTVDGSTLGLDGLSGIKGCFQQTSSRAEPSLTTSSDLVPLPDELHLYSSLQDIGCFENVGIMNSIDLFQTDVGSSSNWCDGSELLDYPLIDECLFA